MKLCREISALAVALLALLAPPVMSRAASPAEGLADGPGIWMNMWNYPEEDYESYCLKLHSKGIRNLFVQVSRSNTEAVVHPEKLGPLIDACHRYKIRVLAWSFAELRSPEADADKLIEACHFQSASGQHMDGLAANLEKDLTAAKVEAYSLRLRHSLGSTYPMIAVVYSPLNMAPQVAQIPWPMLGQYYDVIAPMNYWNSKYKKLDPYEYTKATVQRVRQLVGRPDVEIHVIGDAMGTTSASINQFFKACQESAATSASLYPNQRMTADQMECISHYSEYFPVNSRFRLAALREMIKKGIIESPANVNPAQAMMRGEFYKMLVRQIYVGKPQGMTAETAAAFLDRSGVLEKANNGPDLNQPIESQEAYKVVASLVEVRSSGGKANAKTANRKTTNGHWFSQPAFAAEKPAVVSKPLSYLDAAQLVLQASSSLR